MITLAVFDMAGTTVNDGGAVYRALAQAVEETGVRVSDEHLQTWMGTEKRAAITALIELGGGDSAVPEGKVDETFERFQEILAGLYRSEVPVPVAGVPDAIRELRAAGVKVALTTGFSQEVARGILTQLGWVIASETADPTASTLTIDALVTADEVAAGRPAPYMIHRAMERTGVTRVSEVLVAGDTVVDVQSGVNAGARITAGVLTGELRAEDFAVEPAALVVDSVAAIPELIASVNASSRELRR